MDPVRRVGFVRVRDLREVLEHVQGAHADNGGGRTTALGRHGAGVAGRGGGSSHALSWSRRNTSHRNATGQTSTVTASGRHP